MTDTLARVDIELDQAPAPRPSRPPTWPMLLAAVAVTAVLTTVISAYTNGGAVTAPQATPTPAPTAPAVRIEVTGDGDGQLETVRPPGPLTIGGPSVDVLTVRSRGGKAWCRIYVDDVLTVERVADAGSTAVCTWWNAG